MFTLPWNDNLLTGIDTIDQQHKEFVATINMFIMKAEKDKNSINLNEIFESLSYYASVHFQAEESFMSASQFMDHRNHEAEHKQILFKLKGLMIRGADPSEDKEELANEVLEFTRDWLVNHISNWDKKFSIHYRKYIEDNKNES